MPELPLAYFITFATYGTRLHGDARGSVDRRRNRPGTPAAGYDERRWEAERTQLKGPPVTFQAAQRAVVSATIREVADHRSWTLHALNVRTNHVHVVASSNTSAERVMDDFKRWATRRLRERRLVAPSGDLWSRHGSTRWIWNQENLAEVVEYVHFGQGGWIQGCGAPRPPRAVQAEADPGIGLCGNCTRSRAIESGRGSTFWLCTGAATDPRLKKYPQLPVLRCHGYEPVGAADNESG